MSFTQLALPFAPPPRPQPTGIAPCQVWTTLTPGQHQQVAQIVTEICQEIVPALRVTPTPEGSDD